MARLARIVVPGLPHHVTQRGNRREPICFADGDQQVYLGMLAKQTQAFGVEVWAYCLMPNHVHLVLAPRTESGLARAVGETHRQYTSFINDRAGWTGHLFQSRFASAVMDEDHFWNAVLYVSLNPVHAGLCKRAVDWRWSSVHAHIDSVDDGLVKVEPVLQRFGNFAVRLAEAEGAPDVCTKAFAALRTGERTGRPVGSDAFVAGLERLLGRPLAARPGGNPASR